MSLADESYGFNPLRGSSNDLSDKDFELIEQAAKPLFEDTSLDTGATATWDNAQSGNRGTVTFTHRFTYKGFPCKGLKHVIFFKKRQRTFDFKTRRCQVESGAWKIL